MGGNRVVPRRYYSDAKTLLEFYKSGGRVDEDIPVDRAEFFELATGHEPIAWQRRFFASRSKRRILNISRQGSKSTVAGAWALHLALHRPGSLILLGAPGTRQSSELLNKIRAMYSRIGSPAGYEGDSQTRLEFRSGSRILALPSNPDLVRGFSGPAAILLDEFSRHPFDEEMLDALTPMMASNPECALILMSTPAGRRGAFFEIWERGGPQWERFLATADDIPWITPEFLQEERARMTEYVWQEEYYGVFHAGAGGVFAPHKISAAIRPGANVWR